jgi:signal peptidase I
MELVVIYGIITIIMAGCVVLGYVAYEALGGEQKQEVVKTVKEREREVTRTVGRYRDEIVFEDGTDIGVEYHEVYMKNNRIYYKFREEMDVDGSGNIEWEDNNRALINFDNVKYIDEIGVVAKDEFSDTYTYNEVTYEGTE